MHQIKTPIFIVWLMALFIISIGSLYPIDALPMGPGPINDKIMHGLAYMVVGFLAIFAAKFYWIEFVFMLISVLFGVVIEFLQPLTGRHFEIADMVANSTGILAAFIIVHIFRSRNRLKKHNL